MLQGRYGTLWDQFSQLAVDLLLELSLFYYCKSCRIRTTKVDDSQSRRISRRREQVKLVIEMTDETQVRLLDMKDVSKLTGLSPSTLYRMRTEKPYQGPPYVKIGPSIRFPLEGLKSWIDSQVVSASEASR